jgi:hypothetical protein
MDNSPTPDPRAAVAAEAARIQESATYSAQGQFEASKSWRTWNWLLGGFTAIASGMAGVLTFATDDLQTLSGILALVAAVAAAVHATLKPDKKAERGQRSANEYLQLQSTARKFLTIDVPTGPADQLRSSLDELSERADTINQSSDAIPRFAYKRAKKNMEVGGQTYEVDGG